MIVSLAFFGGVMHIELTHALGQAVAKCERGPIALTREEVLPPELALVDRGIEAVGELVALEPLGAILLGDDVGMIARLQECAQAAGMVDVAGGVDSGMQRCVFPPTNGPMHRGAQAI